MQEGMAAEQEDDDPAHALSTGPDGMPTVVSDMFTTGFQHQTCFNNIEWGREPADFDGRPVFKQLNSYDPYFCYFRKKWNTWVLDDIIDADGAVFAQSVGADINGTWSVSPAWEDDEAITVEDVVDPLGHEGKAIRIRYLPLSPSLSPSVCPQLTR